jgi:hypothetical protein
LKKRLMDSLSDIPGSCSRRRFLSRNGLGFGSLALAGLFNDEASAGIHFPGKAKSVIHVFLNGGMSQVDTFDPKPELTRRGGQELPYENLLTERRTGVALPSPFEMRRQDGGDPLNARGATQPRALADASQYR